MMKNDTKVQNDNMQTMTVLTDVCLITCIVQRGYAEAIVSAAQDAGAHGATIYYGQGTGEQQLLGVLSVAVDAEKEIIEMLVPNDYANHIYEAMFLAGKLDTPGMGVIYTTQIDKAATYIHPEVLIALREKV